MRQSYYRPQYVSCPSVCLSVCPVRARNYKTKTRKNKIKIGINVPQGTSKWNANFQLKRSKVKVTGRKKAQKFPAYMFIYGRRVRRRLQTRPNPLLGLVWFGEWDPARPAAYHVIAATSFLVYCQAITNDLRNLWTSTHGQSKWNVPTCRMSDWHIFFCFFFLYLRAFDNQNIIDFHWRNPFLQSTVVLLSFCRSYK